jgi:membrane protease YdiL (CAAX protease family)
VKTSDSEPVSLVGAPRPYVGSPKSWLRFLACFALLYAVLAVTSAVDATGRWGLAILAAVLVPAGLLEFARTGGPLTTVVRRLGFARRGGRALAIAAVASSVVLLVHPLTAAITDTPVRLRPQWLWLLIGLFAFHGLAEELVWRGFAFRRLREGRTFKTAVLWTMPLMAATHLPIILTLGWTVGLSAMLVAAVTSLPLSYLYETGGHTLWAPAMVHTAIDSFKLFVIPTAALPTFSALIIGASLFIPLLVLTVPRRFLATDGPAAVQTSLEAPRAAPRPTHENGANRAHTGKPS